MDTIAKGPASTTVFFADKRYAMIDGIRSKIASAETNARKSAKAAEAPPPLVAAEATTVEISTARNQNASTAAPIDSGKVAAIRDAIRNKAYPLDFEKLADRMIEADLLRGNR